MNNLGDEFEIKVMVMCYIFMIPYAMKMALWIYQCLENLAIWQSVFATAKLKICQNFLLAHKRVAIPYQTAKFKSNNPLK